MVRRLAAILAADVAGYSRLMSQDEAGTLAELKTHRSELIEPAIAKYGGRVVKLMGDGILAEFSSVVAAELWTGVMKSRERGRNEQALREFLAFVDVRDFPAEAARAYGEIRAELEAKGRSIGAMDLLIAVHAVHERATLVTRNSDEFKRVGQLKVESWKEP